MLILAKVIKKYLKNRPHAEIYLDSDPTAESFYEKIGMELVGRGKMARFKFYHNDALIFLNKVENILGKQ